MIDYIISSNDEVYAKIDYNREVGIDNFYSGLVLEYKFPDRLSELINDYSEIIDSMALSLLDDVEAEIYSYGLKLRDKRVSIFNVEIKGMRLITFFTRYPTGQGFVDKFPG